MTKHLTGIGYIPTLVSTPDRSIDGVTLRGGDRNVLGRDFSPMYLADPETINDVLAELDDVNEAIADARTRQDERGQERAQEKKEFLIRYLLEVAGRTGQLQTLKGADLDEACRKTVAAYRKTGRLNRWGDSISDKEWHAAYSAFKRAFVSLRSAGEPGRLMAEHLESTIDMKVCPHFAYRPRRPVPHWEL